jgi:hypothetical protein
MSDPRGTQTIANFPDLISAQLAQSLLEAGEIASDIPDEGIAGIDWRMATALHGIRLQVAPEDVEAATALLANGGNIEPLDAGDSVGNEREGLADRCPACGSSSIGSAPWKRRLKAVSLLVPILILAWPLLVLVRPPLACLSCGQGLKDLP